ncbi:hypothetical protein PIB30_037339 [Stylosanthes scabra]|uniref:Uncharacterized protein n=1 Tax=Stylosanthes scabra TaxID=79078 RepID=A0ABU6RDP8_9FABA|nr:hypothetical protein [Stylosanthes scabra]
MEFPGQSMISFGSHLANLMMNKATFDLRAFLPSRAQESRLKRSSIMETFYRSGSNNGFSTKKGGSISSRFWKVKLVITPEQLVEILEGADRECEDCCKAAMAIPFHPFFLITGAFPAPLGAFSLTLI